MRQPPGTLARYTVGARINHWITAGCLILLTLSGMAPFHPALFFLSALFGGGVVGDARSAVPIARKVVVRIGVSGRAARGVRTEPPERSILGWILALPRTMFFQGVDFDPIHRRVHRDGGDGGALFRREKGFARPRQSAPSVNDTGIVWLPTHAASARPAGGGGVTWVLRRGSSEAIP